MHYLILFSLILSLTMVSCKCKEKNTKQEDLILEGTLHKGENFGTITHNYKGGTCTVILLEGDETKVLIPVDGLPEALNEDGKMIHFNYLPLRVMQPEGCNEGIPVQLNDVSE